MKTKTRTYAIQDNETGEIYLVEGYSKAHVISWLTRGRYEAKAADGKMVASLMAGGRKVEVAEVIEK